MRTCGTVLGVVPKMGRAECERAIDAAHTEAKGARNGIGLVKLMGRESGFIAVFASLARSDACVSGLGLGQCQVFVERQVGTEVLVFLGARQQVLRGFDAGGLLVGNGGGQFGHAQAVELVHSITLGTRNRPRSTAGALFWFASRLLGSLATSGRRRKLT